MTITKFSMLEVFSRNFAFSHAMSKLVSGMSSLLAYFIIPDINTLWSQKFCPRPFYTYFVLRILKKNSSLVRLGPNNRSLKVVSFKMD